MTNVTELRELLPAVFRPAAEPGTPLLAMLEAMVALLGPAEDQVDQFSRVLDPRRTPERFVLMLASWVDLDRLQLDDRDGIPEIPIGVGRLRELVANVGDLIRTRGTAQGLCRFLQIATGEADFAIEERVLDANDEVRPFHIRVRGPAALESQRDFVEQIIASERPAHLTYEFVTSDDAGLRRGEAL